MGYVISWFSTIFVLYRIFYMIDGLLGKPETRNSKAGRLRGVLADYGPEPSAAPTNQTRNSKPEGGDAFVA
jgi:hypothetical protein